MSTNTTTKTTASKSSRKKTIIALVLLLAGNLILFLTIWLLNKYDKIALDQVLFQMKSSAAGVNRSIMGSAYIRVLGLGLLAMGLELLLYRLLSGNWTGKFRENMKYVRFRTSKTCKRIAGAAVPMALIFFFTSSTLFVTSLDVADYLVTTSTKSDFIEQHYVSPNDVAITFPEEKRNLIYIFLESMENTFAQPEEAGGNITANFIPELSQLAANNVNFSHSSGLGGALPYTGTTWTAAAMVAQTSGVGVKVPLTAGKYGGDKAFIPGVISIGEILEDAGYQQTLLVGSDVDFGGRGTYFTEHGNYNIIDINSLKAEGKLPQDYQEWWGYEDKKLFEFAKEELTRLGQTGEPFNFTMLTADTHFPDGYVCPDCGTSRDSQYGNVLTCSSSKIGELLEWIKAQDFYENTTIVLSGDHLTMDPDFMKSLNEDYVRTVYNCFINAPVEPVQEKNRLFATFDMMPTTLAAMGVQIEGDRLALGTNLFSDKKTLTEEYGFEMLNKELQKKSVYYNTEFLGMTSSKNKNQAKTDNMTNK